LGTGNNKLGTRNYGGWEQVTTEVENREQHRLGTGNNRGREQGTKGVGNRERTEAENRKQQGAGNRIIDAEKMMWILAGRQKYRLGKLAEVRPLGIKKDLFCTKISEDLI
jgi:hypothetical protein